MALCEDVFDDTMPPCEKLYNAQEACNRVFVNWCHLVTINLYMIVAPPDYGLPDHWK